MIERLDEQIVKDLIKGGAAVIRLLEREREAKRGVDGAGGFVDTCRALRVMRVSYRKIIACRRQRGLWER